MKAIVLENYDSVLNDYIYKEGEIVDVTELERFKDYAIYREETLDWIPKKLVRLL